MIRLFVNYYQDPNPERQKELEECISKNIANPLLDKIYLITDAKVLYQAARNSTDKLYIMQYDGRPTYSFLFNLANEHSTPGDIIIIANIDIFFGERALMLVQNYLGRMTCFALSRWEKSGDGVYYLLDRPDSQDSWLFRCPIATIANAEFTMGKPGCDNAIAQRIEAAGYSIFNPSHHIQSFHVHDSGIRYYNSYDPIQVVDEPYKLLPPTTLNDFPLLNWVAEIPFLTGGTEHSQYNEEVIIDHIFRNIGVTDRFFVDLGAGAYGDATMSNTRKLMQSGWTGYGVDLRNKGENWIIERFITPDNILDIFSQQNTPRVFDFLNLDIDSCDFWVLRKILQEYSPRCVCTEFNGTLNPNTSIVLKYEEGYTWDETNRYGYSFAAGQKLLAEHGYRIIHNMLNQNIFAVQEGLVRGLIFEVTANEAHYHPHSYTAIWEPY